MFARFRKFGNRKAARVLSTLFSFVIVLQLNAWPFRWKPLSLRFLRDQVIFMESLKANPSVYIFLNRLFSFLIKNLNRDCIIVSAQIVTFMRKIVDWIRLTYFPYLQVLPYSVWRGIWNIMQFSGFWKLLGGHLGSIGLCSA